MYTLDTCRAHQPIPTPQFTPPYPKHASSFTLCESIDLLTRTIDSFRSLPTASMAPASCPTRSTHYLDTPTAAGAAIHAVKQCENRSAAALTISQPRRGWVTAGTPYLANALCGMRAG